MLATICAQIGVPLRAVQLIVTPPELPAFVEDFTWVVVPEVVMDFTARIVCPASTTVMEVPEIPSESITKSVSVEVPTVVLGFPVPTPVFFAVSGLD